MISIFVTLSDIPQYIAQFVSELTGADMSRLTNGFSDFLSSVFEAINKLVA